MTADEPMSTPDSGGLREAVALHQMAVEDNPGHADWHDCATTGPCRDEGRRLAALLAAHPEPVPTPDSADDATVGERECRCAPCPGRGNDGHTMTHCAECCWGTGVETEYGCPIHNPATPPAGDANRAPVSGGLDEGEREALSASVRAPQAVAPDMAMVYEAVERILAARDAEHDRYLSANRAAVHAWQERADGERRRAEAAEAERDTARREKADAWWSGHLHGCEDTGRLKADGHREMHDADNPFRARADALTSDDGSGA